MMELMGYGINEKRIQTSLRKPKRRIHVQEIGIDGIIILKYILQKWGRGCELDANGSG